MIFFTCLLLGFVVASLGSITPSFLNLTVVKFSLRNGVKAALYLIGGYVFDLTSDLKFKPSFGGFVLVAKAENEIIACVVAVYMSVN